MLGFAIAPSATIPAPAVIPVRWWEGYVTAWRRLKRVMLFLLIPLGLSLACLYWLANQTIRGRFRHHLRPLWVACLAWYPAWWTPLVWLGTAVALYLFPTALRLLPMGDRISPREQAGLADAACLLAAWQVIAPGLDLPVQVALFLEFTGAGLFPWWMSRAWHTEPEVALEVHPLVEQWAWEVAEHPKAGPLANTWLTHDPETGRFHLRAPIDGEDGVEGAAERACRLMCRPRGTITISPAPNEEPWDANDFFVALTERHDAAVVRYLSPDDLKSIDIDGTFITADTADGRAIRSAVRGPSGAAHGLILAPTRYGKGFVMRQYGVGLALWEKAWLNVADCKGETEGGAGVPELRHGADMYGWTRDQWRACVEMHHEIFAARAGRYGRAGRNFWHPDAEVDGYPDPLAALMMDEKRKMIRAWGKAIVGKLEDMSSQGASFGISVIENTQKGDAESVGSTAFRNDIRGNGTVYIGRFEDAQAARDATQGFDVDPMKLPNAKGWWYLKSAIHAIPLVPMRTRVLPTGDEVEFQGFDAPYGTVEDWLVNTRHAKLHPQDAEIVAKWADWFADATPASEPEPPPAPEPVREMVEVAAGVHVEQATRILHAVPTQPLPDTKAAIDMIVEVLRQSGPMTRGDIVKAIRADGGRIADTYASERLKTLEGLGKVARTTTANGRAAWKATA